MRAGFENRWSRAFLLFRGALLAAVLLAALPAVSLSDDEEDDDEPKIHPTEVIIARDLDLDPSTAARVFPVGEELRFSIRYGPVRAGEATMHVVGTTAVDGVACYHIRSTAKSSRFFSTFFPVDDRVETFMEVERLISRRFEKRLREGKYKQNLSFRIDPARDVAIYDDGQEVAVPPKVQDVLSAFYFVRLVDLRVGTEVHVENHDKKKNFPLAVQVLREERITTPAGTFSCVVVEPLLKAAGLFKQEGRMTIWLTNDERKIPVLMKSKVKVGSIIAELESMTVTGEANAARGALGP